MEFCQTSTTVEQLFEVYGETLDDWANGGYVHDLRSGVLRCCWYKLFG